MGDFSADWLQLREPADERARSSEVARGLIDRVAGRPLLRVLDLATGTGANVRYLADRLPCDQKWLLVDHDDRLVAGVPARMARWAADRGWIGRSLGDVFEMRGAHTCRLSTRCLDIGKSHPDLFDDRDIVTASALLDLVSESWLERLVSECRRVKAGVLFALIYDGRAVCSPAHDDDEMIRKLVNEHQQSDKGLGPALGPAAASRFQALLAAADYHVAAAPSDWILGPADGELQRQLVDGWASAAEQIAPDEAARIDRWRAARHALIDRRQSTITVGHQDVGGWLG